MTAHAVNWFELLVQGLFWFSGALIGAFFGGLIGSAVAEERRARLAARGARK